MFVTFWTLEQAGSVTWGFEYPEKLLMGGKADQAGVGGMCCSSPGPSAGDGYGAGSTLGLKQYIYPGDILIRPERFYWSLETTSHNRKILCYKPHLGLLCSTCCQVPTRCQGQRGSFWQTPEMFPPRGRRWTHHRPPIWSSSSCCFGNVTELWLRRPKKEPFLSNVVSGQSCAPTKDDSDNLKCLKPFDIWKIFLNCKASYSFLNYLWLTLKHRREKDGLSPLIVKE